ncbi:carbon dioxide concentrating mechanism/carboxysome shell protein [Moorena producens 3L]|nr:carbon dioxide concentrating mechanism/carboxysome shell protein [Moorena producens 3L]
MAQAWVLNWLVCSDYRFSKERLYAVTTIPRVVSAWVDQNLDKRLGVKFMSIAVGMVETLGFPAVVEAADAMVKAARVTLVGYEKIGSARVTVIVRGDVSEVQASVSAGVDNVKRVNGGQVLSTHIIARPHENLEYVLPIRYTEDVEQFRESTNAIRPMNRP